MAAWTEKAHANTLQASIEQLTQAAHDLSDAMADGGSPPEVVLLALERNTRLGG